MAAWLCGSLRPPFTHIHIHTHTHTHTHTRLFLFSPSLIRDALGIGSVCVCACGRQTDRRRMHSAIKRCRDDHKKRAILTMVIEKATMRRTGPSGSRAATGRPQGGGTANSTPQKRQFDRIAPHKSCTTHVGTGNHRGLLPVAGRSRHGSRTALSASLWSFRSRR